MRPVILLIGPALVVVTIYYVCGQKPVADIRLPTAQETFRAAETNGFQDFDTVGRFVPINVPNQVAILDTRLGNIFYFSFESKQWSKIVSPLASNAFRQPNFFDTAPVK